MTDTIGEVAPQAQVTTLTGRRIPWARVGLIALAVVVLASIIGLYYKKNYTDLTEKSAMDQAQVAKCIRTGEGFTTRFIRPFNVGVQTGDLVTVPELNNGPLYPYYLSVLFKFKEPCDQIVRWASIGFLSLTLIAAFVLGRLLFDLKIGLAAAGTLGLSATILRVGTSGTELTLAAFLLTLVLIVVALHHRASSVQSAVAPLIYSALTAALTAALYMTNYVFAFSVVPLAIYFGVTGRHRKPSLAAFLILAVALMAPCAYRNAVQTGFPVLGVRAWDVMADTLKYPGDVLYRSTDPAYRSPAKALLFPFEEFGSFSRKVVTRCSDMAAALPSAVGLAALAFAMVSALYRFRQPAANAVRGLFYVLAPVMIIVFAAYRENTDYVIVFAPALAVFAAAYLILLIEAKKLHPFFARTLVAAFLLVTAIQSLQPLIWGTETEALYDQYASTTRYFTQAGSRGVTSLVYTDVPWVAAWRTLSPAVWLPFKDDDIQALEARGFVMRVVILTPECETYAPDESWWLLHKVRLWREYVHDPQQGLAEIMKAVKITPDQLPKARKLMQRLKRDYAVSTSISGFVPKQQNPLGPDDIQILLHPDIQQ